VFISADIEGVAGITAPDEAKKGSPGYPTFRAQMDAEVAAACDGAFAGGANDVVVKDAHGDGRNLSPAALPAPARLIRGYNGHPFAMVQGLDDTFDAAMFVGYHSRAGSGGNPLSHTLSSTKLFSIRLDGEPVSELRLHALAAGTVGVPRRRSAVIARRQWSPHHRIAWRSSSATRRRRTCAASTPARGWPTTAPSRWTPTTTSTCSAR